jgi:ribokinase
MNRIVVVGSLNADLVATVPKLPSRGETIAADAFEIHAGGKGANQAVAAARLGAEVSMVGMVGSDQYGDMLLAGLADAHVDTHLVGRSHASTGIALILVDTTGENLIAVVSGANADLKASDAVIALDKLPDASLVVVQLETPLTVVERVCREASRAGKQVVLNAAPYRPDMFVLLRNVDVLVVNELEASSLFGVEVRDQPTAHAALGQRAGRGPRLTVITLGDQGVVYCEAGSKPESIDAIPVEVVDTTGAGDAFVGALAFALSKGWSSGDAVYLGVATGAAKVARAGAQSSLPTMADVKRLSGIDARMSRLASA